MGKNDILPINSSTKALKAILEQFQRVYKNRVVVPFLLLYSFAHICLYICLSISRLTSAKIILK